jgi:hypothetical protein
MTSPSSIAFNQSGGSCRVPPITAEQVASDHAGGVTVTGVVNRRQHTVMEVRCSDRASHGDRERFLTNPATTRPLQRLGTG